MVISEKNFGNFVAIVANSNVQKFAKIATNLPKKSLCFAHESGIIINECWILSTLHLAYINAPDVDCHFLTSRNPTLL